MATMVWQKPTTSKHIRSKTMRFIYYWDPHQPGMTEERARAQIEPILDAGDTLALIPRPGCSEVVTLPTE
jgi:hypothetical protein